jgi:hypothetical protein
MSVSTEAPSANLSRIEIRVRMTGRRPSTEDDAVELDKPPVQNAAGDLLLCLGDAERLDQQHSQDG